MTHQKLKTIFFVVPCIKNGMAQSTMLICLQFLIIDQSSRPFRVYYLVVSRDNGEPFDKSIN